MCSRCRVSFRDGRSIIFVSIITLTLVGSLLVVRREVLLLWAITLALLDVVVTSLVHAKVLGHLLHLLVAELRHLVGNGECPLLLNVCLGEDQVNLLKVTTSCLGVEEPSSWHSQQVDQGKEERSW
ncbi:hypothetical protein KC326_g27 [Hortaea werneckii]|nr:hypothetical protein KC326_g27 [Hortaea werneckii]